MPVTDVTHDLDSRTLTITAAGTRKSGSPSGQPIALLANYSMHYYESPLLSSDYFGRFATKIGAGGRVTFAPDGKPIGSGDLPVTIPLSLGLAAGVSVGADNSSPVMTDYKPPFAFTGTV